MKEEVADLLFNRRNPVNTKSGQSCLTLPCMGEGPLHTSPGSEPFGPCSALQTQQTGPWNRGEENKASCMNDHIDTVSGCLSMCVVM